MHKLSAFLRNRTTGHFVTSSAKPVFALRGFSNFHTQCMHPGEAAIAADLKRITGLQLHITNTANPSHTL